MRLFDGGLHFLKQLAKARKNKNDEFYTQYETVRKELVHYKEYLKGKSVYLPCDSVQSNFWKYLYDNFKEYGLKSLTCLYYNKDYEPLFPTEVIKTSFDGDNIVEEPLFCSGSFDCEESIDIMKKSDVIITNPPFSRFNEVIQMLVEYEKDYILVGTILNLTRNKNRELYKNKKIKLGYIVCGTEHFILPDYYEKYSFIKNDVKFGTITNITVYTSFDIVRDVPFLDLSVSYNKENYECYINYGKDIINIDKIKDIPYDYYGLMGVPITSLSKINTNQFEIVNISSTKDISYNPNKKYHYFNQKVIDTNHAHNLFIRYNPKLHKAPTCEDIETGEQFVIPFHRLIIRQIKRD